MADITDKMKQESPALSEENERAQQLPAIFANRFWVMSNPSTFRIAFAEGFEGKNYQYRTAVMVPVSDAKALGQLLLRLAAKYEQGATENPETPHSGPHH